MIKQPIKIGLADDQTLFRRTLAGYLSQQDHLDIVFDVSDGLELLNKLKTNLVDIIILDLSMPRLDGAQALVKVRSDYPYIKPIVVTFGADAQIINSLLEIGIYGFISKFEEPDELVRAIRHVSENKIHRNKYLTDALYLSNENSILTNKDTIKVNLTERELRIIELLWAEKNNHEIASLLFLSIRSIEKLRQDLKEKLNVSSTVGLFKYALRHKLITIPT